MARLYLRKVELQIYPSSGSSTKISDLRIKFKVEKTNESNPNKAVIDIYNLNDKTRSSLEGKNTRVALSIGYEDTIEVVTIGNVTKASHKREEVDIITTIEVADGGNKFRNARLNKGYPPGANTKDVVNDLVKEIGLPVAALEGVPEIKYAHGISVNGLARDSLTKLCKKNKLEWSIQDEAIQVIPQDKGTNEGIVILNVDSGLVGFPAKTDKGVEFSSLLQPRLKPGRRVKLESRVVSGVFKLRKVSHEGDSHQGDFLSKCEASVK